MKDKNSKLSELLSIFRSFPQSEYETLIDILYDELSLTKNKKDESVHSLASNNDNTIVCKLCGSVHVVKNGNDSYGHQRYLCRDCRKTFTLISGSVVSGTHKNVLVWKKYIKLLLEGKSLSVSARECNICIDTAFSWRHKILNALAKQPNFTGFSGMIEMDELFVRISYKGNHTHSKNFILPRKSFKRGSDNHISEHNSKACILCVVERDKGFSGVIPCRGNLNGIILDKLFTGKISDESIVMTDGLTAYRGYFQDTKILHIKLTPIGTGNKKKPTVKGAYHINNVNALHSRFRKFLNRYHGVATKYLNNYLSLFLWLENNKSKLKDVLLCEELCKFGTKLRYKDLKTLPHEPEPAPAA